MLGIFMTLLLFHVDMRYYLCQVDKGWIVVAIPSCQLDYIWNELQSRIGRLTYDPNLEAQRYKFLTRILTWRSWSIVAMNSRRLRQGDLWVQGHLELKVWWHMPLIWATPFARDIRTLEGGRVTLTLPCLLASWDWATARSLDFHPQLLLAIVWELDYRL